MKTFLLTALFVFRAFAYDPETQQCTVIIADRFGPIEKIIVDQYGIGPVEEIPADEVSSSAEKIGPFEQLSGAELLDRLKKSMAAELREDPRRQNSANKIKEATWKRIETLAADHFKVHPGKGVGPFLKEAVAILRQSDDNSTKQQFKEIFEKTKELRETEKHVLKNLSLPKNTYEELRDLCQAEFGLRSTIICIETAVDMLYAQLNFRFGN